MAIDGADGDDVVAVHQRAGVVDGEEAVGVAVEGEAEIGAELDGPWRPATRCGSPRTRR